MKDLNKKYFLDPIRIKFENREIYKKGINARLKEKNKEKREAWKHNLDPLISKKSDYQFDYRWNRPVKRFINEIVEGLKNG